MNGVSRIAGGADIRQTDLDPVPTARDVFVRVVGARITWRLMVRPAH